MKRLIAILLACALAVQPVYADNAKRGKRQKTKEEIEIEKVDEVTSVKELHAQNKDPKRTLILKLLKMSLSTPLLSRWNYALNYLEVCTALVS